MLHLKNSHYYPVDSTKLLLEARRLSPKNNVIIRDTRVSKRYVEFDISIEKEKFESLVATLKSIGELDHYREIVEEQLEKKEAVKMGIFYFNNERFWECHEVFEGIWKNAYEGEKDLIQSIILVAAALVHFQKDQNSICLSILDRALEKLSRSTGDYYEIDLDKLRKNVEEIKETKKISTFLI